jgi:O-antigen/teichoic acid export membrane protein
MWNFVTRITRHEADRANFVSSEYYSTTRLRSAGIVFLIGKALTAPLNIFILYVLASRLSRSDFAIYVWLIAFGEAFLSLSTFGLDWVATNYVPYLRARADGRLLRRFVLRLGAVRMGSIALLAAACWLAAAPLATWFGQAQWLRAFDLYLAVLIAEGALRYGQDFVLAPLWKQGSAQVQVLVRHLGFLAALALALVAFPGAFTVERVLWALLFGTLLALALGVVQFALVVRQLAGSAGGSTAALPDWRALASFAANNYAQSIVRLASGGPALTLLAAPLIGAGALAMFGYARSLSQQFSRLLPSQLFMGLLRPKLVAGYAIDGSFESLNRRVVLALKASNCVFAAGLAVVVTHGEPLLGHLSGDNYGGAYGVLLLLLLGLAVANAEGLVAVVVNTLERSEFVRRASLGLLVVLPAAAVLAWLGTGAYGLAVAMLGGEVLFLLLIIRQMRRIDRDLAFDRAGHARIAGAFLVACSAGLLLAAVLPARLDADLAGAAGTLLAFLAAVRVLRPFDRSERAAIERLLGRRLVLL